MIINLDKSVELAIELSKAVALLVSGLWVAWTFQKLQKARAATLDVVERKNRLLSQQPQLSIKLSITEEPSISDDFKSLLCIAVSLTNQGEQNLETIFDSDSLIVAKVSLERKHSLTAKPVFSSSPSWLSSRESAGLEALPNRVFKVGATRSMVLAVIPVPEPSVYFIQFKTVFYKVPFEGDDETPEETIHITAIEQAFHVSGMHERST